MKNIHVIQTDKPSRLIKFKDESNLLLSSLPSTKGEKFNIYITNSEEIKEGVNQWYLDKFLNKPYNSGGAQYGEKQNVIILTDNKDLIKDGVQAIDDEFLEWFVKNPNCEFVKVERIFKPHEITQDDFCITCDSNGCNLDNEEKHIYKTIIPKEEPKQFTTEMLVDLKQGLDNAIQKSNPLFPNYKHLNKLETLEEVAEKLILEYELGNTGKIDTEDAKEMLIEFAKYQAERSYNEEDLKQAYLDGCKIKLDNVYHLNKWFKNFKKK